MDPECRMEELEHRISTLERTVARRERVLQRLLDLVTAYAESGR
jgi:uncharacterized coiled-coil protein SlyX